MIVNPEKFEAIFQKNKRNTSEYPVVLTGHEIKTQEFVTLLGVTLDYNLSFEEHISNLCQKASAQFKKTWSLHEPSDSKNHGAIIYLSALQLLPFSLVFYIFETN